MVAVEEQGIVDDLSSQPLGILLEEVVNGRHDDDAVARLAKGEVRLIDGGDDARAIGYPIFLDLPVMHSLLPMDDALVVLVRCKGITHHITVQPFFQGC